MIDNIIISIVNKNTRPLSASSLCLCHVKMFWRDLRLTKEVQNNRWRKKAWELTQLAV